MTHVYKRLYFEYPDGSHRKVTDEEQEATIRKVKKIKELKRRIAQAEIAIKRFTASCDHKIFYDEPGHPYDVRHCPICGHTSLI